MFKNIENKSKQFIETYLCSTKYQISYNSFTKLFLEIIFQNFKTLIEFPLLSFFFLSK